MERVELKLDAIKKRQDDIEKAIETLTQEVQKEFSALGRVLSLLAGVTDR